MTGSLASLIPTPLHPAIVHLPMALVVLLPIFAIVALLVVHRGGKPLRAWGVAAAMFAALTLSSWASMETGEEQEDRVEAVVPDLALDTHEDAAEQFMWLSVGVLGVAALGLLKGGVGTGARVVATVASLGLLVAGYRVGHSGGELVYTYGAASVYSDSATTARVAERSDNDR